MMRVIRSLWLGLTAAALVGAGADDDPAAYRVRIAVTPGAGSTVQRLTIPAAALIAAQTADLSDLRIFDARGRAMPIARLPAGAGSTRRDTLEAMPILGAADALTVERVSLRVDDQGRARVAQVDGKVAGAGGRSIVLGALFDARAIVGTARALALDVAVPAAQPVTFVVEASRDLSVWRPVGEKVVYRAAAGSAGADATIPLSAAIDRDYLKVTWRLGSRALAPVAVRQAVLLSRPSDPGAGVVADATLPALRDAHDLTFVIPFRTPIATIRIVPRGDDVVVPVRILGRDDAEQPWTLLGTGIATRPAGGAATAAIAIGSGAYRTLRIEADARTAGFTTPPSIRFGFAAGDLLFLAAGPAPFTLAAGRAGGGSGYLVPAILMAQGGGRPPAIATAAAAPARVTLAEVEEGRFGGARLVLWGVLLLATGLLAVLARLLWKRRP